MIPVLNHSTSNAIFRIKDKSIFTNLILKDETYFHPDYLSEDDYLHEDEYKKLQELLINEDVNDINETCALHDPNFNYITIKGIQFPKNWYNIEKGEKQFYNYSFAHCKHMFVVKLDTYKNLTILINEAIDHGFEIQDLNIDNLTVSMFNKKNKNKGF